MGPRSYKFRIVVLPAEYVIFCIKAQTDHGIMHEGGHDNYEERGTQGAPFGDPRFLQSLFKQVSFIVYVESLFLHQRGNDSPDDPQNNRGDAVHPIGCQGSNCQMPLPTQRLEGRLGHISEHTQIR